MKTINYKAIEEVRMLISPDIKILDFYIENKWLVAVLSSGIRFKVKNEK